MAQFKKQEGTPSAFNRNLANNIKSSHFSCAENTSRTPDQVTQQYTSEKKAAFDYKGNPQNVKSTLDLALKEDLRASHFHVGGSGSVKSSTVSKSFKKISLDELAKSRQPFQDLKGRVKV